MNKNEPAYPLTFERHCDLNIHEGLTKREAFAMAAMQGLLTSKPFPREHLARAAVEYADALLAALEETP